MADQEKITKEDILRLERKCLEKIASEELYQLRNDAKLRACVSSKTYDEFKDIVAAAHLRPISKADKNNSKTKSRLWNPEAKN